MAGLNHCKISVKISEGLEKGPAEPVPFELYFIDPSLAFSITGGSFSYPSLPLSLDSQALFELPRASLEIPR